jgi:hypothetical protein
VDAAVLLVFTKLKISGNSNVDVAVLLVLTKSNISGNSKVAVAVLILQVPHENVTFFSMPYFIA